MSERLKIAAQKSGRLADASLDLLKRCGIQFARSRDRLFCFGENMPVDLLLVRDDDIPGLLAEGVCDLGIVGRNVAEEARWALNGRGANSDFQPLLALGFGACRLSLAVPDGASYRNAEDLAGARIATTYPNLLQRFLASEEIEAETVVLGGSVEIAPSLGTADAICDLVSTGATLEANRLREMSVVLESEAMLYRGAKPLGEDAATQLERLLQRMRGVLEVRESKYVMLHAPRSALAAITELLPGAETPTVLPLEGCDDRVAVHAVCRETVFWEHLESLKQAGASAVLVLPVEKMLA